MRKTISKHLFLFLASILVGTGQAFADTDSVSRGDANGDSEVNIGDVVTIVNRINSSTATINEVNGDANGDLEINIGDIVTVINIINNKMLSASGTIEGWTEGNTADELEPQALEGDDEEDSNYGD